MKRKYREAAQAKLRLQDKYIDGLSDDEQAEEVQGWYDEHLPEYAGEPLDSHADEMIPF